MIKFFWVLQDDLLYFLFLGYAVLGLNPLILYVYENEMYGYVNDVWKSFRGMMSLLSEISTFISKYLIESFSTWMCSTSNIWWIDTQFSSFNGFHLG